MIDFVLNNLLLIVCSAYVVGYIINAIRCAIRDNDLLSAVADHNILTSVFIACCAALISIILDNRFVLVVSIILLFSPLIYMASGAIALLLFNSYLPSELDEYDKKALSEYEDDINALTPSQMNHYKWLKRRQRFSFLLHYYSCPITIIMIAMLFWGLL